MNRAILVIYLLLLYSCLAYGQGQSSNWYFGKNAGLQFVNEVPTTISGGQINSEEGCASISTNAGELLFYTDGETIWNSNHTIMETDLAGNQGSTQSAIIVPQPNTPDVYYVFTVDTVSISSQGLRYSVVDMSIGAVVQKNIPLSAGCAERLTAISHDNGEDIWVLSYERLGGQDNIVAYLLTENGITAPPVVSSFSTDGEGRTGQMKVSKAGNKLAVAAEANVGLNGCFFVASFNNSTGEVFGVRKINAGTPYGIEFSPNENKLYVTSRTGPLSNAMRQYDVTILEADRISSSEEIIGLRELPFDGFGALQLAPNNKIYVAKQNEMSLGIINLPNEDGVAAQFLEFAVVLDQESTAGLPQALLFGNGFTVFNTCLGEETQFNAFNSFTPTSVRWDFGDVDSPDNISTEENPTHTYTSAGTYTVTYQASDSFVSRTVQQEVTIYDAFPSSTFIAESCVFEDGLFRYELSDIIGFPLDGNLRVQAYESELDLAQRINAREFPLLAETGDTFYLRITNNGFCPTNSVVQLTNCPELDPCEPAFANAFSPNGDGLHETFGILTKPVCEVEFISFSVRDRWGNVVYDYMETLQPWDGRVDGLIVGGTYLYEAEYRLLNDPRGTISKAGIVTVFR